MTVATFLTDAYQREATAQVTEVSDAGVVLDASIFYPRGGGQPGDVGRLIWDGGVAQIAEAVKGDGSAIVLPLEAGAARPAIGQEVTQEIDWDRRYAHMRVHTMLHLLSVVIPLPVSGGAIAADKGRLDFNMAEPPQDKQALEEALNALIARDLIVSDQWITDAELDAHPGLVKTMSVQPPRGAGQVRLVRIASAGETGETVDLQPCGGTHVARTSEIGVIRFGKIEKKGAQNRRVYVWLG